MLNPAQARGAIVYAAQRQRSAEALGKVQATLAGQYARLAADREAMQRLTSRLSHDMRSQLAVIQDYSSLVREGLAGETTAQQREYLGIVADRVDDLTSTIDDLKDVGSLVWGTLRLWRRPCRIDDVLDDRLVKWARRASSRQVALDVTIPDDLPTVYCDAERIARVVHHLVVESIKRAPPGGQIALWACADEADHVVVGVTMDGPSVDDDEVSAISAELQRAEFDELAVEKLGPRRAVGSEIVRLSLGRMTIECESSTRCSCSFSLPIHEPLSILGQFARQARASAPGDVHLGLLVVRAADGVKPSAVGVVDEFLQSAVSADELAIQIAARQWLLSVRGTATDLAALPQRLLTDWSETLCGLPLESALLIEVSTVGAWHGPTAADDLLSAAQQVLCSLDPDQTSGWQGLANRESAVAGAAS